MPGIRQTGVMHSVVHLFKRGDHLGFEIRVDFNQPNFRLVIHGPAPGRHQTNYYKICTSSI